MDLTAERQNYVCDNPNNEFLYIKNYDNEIKKSIIPINATLNGITTMSDLKLKLSQRMSHEFGKDFLLSLEDQIASSYRKAHELVAEDFSKEMYKQVLGPLQASYLTESLKKAGEVYNLPVSFVDTEPKGGIFVQLFTDSFIVCPIRIESAYKKDAHYLKELASHNRAIESQEDDLFGFNFNGLEKFKSYDKIFVIALIGEFPATKSTPSKIHISFAVPYSDLKGGFHFRVSLEDLLKVPTVNTTALEATPILKKRLADAGKGE